MMKARPELEAHLAIEAFRVLNKKGWRREEAERTGLSRLCY
jgi:hypothetical protein